MVKILSMTGVLMLFVSIGCSGDPDSPNLASLEVGAAAYRAKDTIHWNHMSTAPRDGTWIELKCSYGVAPWYGLARWTTDRYVYKPVSEGSGFEYYQSDTPTWILSEKGHSVSDENYLEWRLWPYQDPDTYTDPTNGIQYSDSYWQGALAAKYGLPLDYFEKRYTK